MTPLLTVPIGAPFTVRAFALRNPVQLLPYPFDLATHSVSRELEARFNIYGNFQHRD